MITRWSIVAFVMVSTLAPAKPRIFYGWWVALAFSLIVFLSTGIRFAVGPFLKPIVSDLGLDRGFLFDLTGGYGAAFGVACALSWWGPDSP